jgi:hypothetical protein
MAVFLDTDDVVDSEVTDTTPCEFGIDFSTGKLTGEKVYGSAAVAVWAWLALRTPRYRSPLFTWSYGSELGQLTGTNYSESYTKARAKKLITDCLKVNEHVTGIKNLEIDFSSNNLSASFTLVTDYGEEELNV